MTTAHFDFNFPFEQLYEHLEGFECDAGCTSCCKGVVSISVPELLKIETLLTDFPPPLEDPDFGCPFRSETGCLVYSVRPFMCRLFGFRFLHPDMRLQPWCPCKSISRSGEVESGMFVAYIKFCEENGFVLLGNSPDVSKNTGPVADNRRAARVFPLLARFSRFLTGGALCFEKES